MDSLLKYNDKVNQSYFSIEVMVNYQVFNIVCMAVGLFTVICFGLRDSEDDILGCEGMKSPNDCINNSIPLNNIFGKCFLLS